jgi:hypothetical protein
MANPTPALETQLALIDYWRSPQAVEAVQQRVIIDNDNDAIVASSACQAIADSLSRGYPYYVDPLICDLLNGSIDDFPEMPARDLFIPAVHGWVHFAVPLLLTGETVGQTEGIKGFSWCLWQWEGEITDDARTMRLADNPSMADQVDVDCFLDDTRVSLPRFVWPSHTDMGEGWAGGSVNQIPWIEGVNPWDIDTKV